MIGSKSLIIYPHFIIFHCHVNKQTTWQLEKQSMRTCTPFLIFSIMPATNCHRCHPYYQDSYFWRKKKRIIIIIRQVNWSMVLRCFAKQILEWIFLISIVLTDICECVMLLDSHCLGKRYCKNKYLPFLLAVSVHFTKCLRWLSSSNMQNSVQLFEIPTTIFWFCFFSFSKINVIK